MSEEKLLEVRDLRKFFQTKAGMLHAVDGISLSLEKGKTIGVVGESGCGKSTLGRTILGLTPATSGQIIFQGEDITNLTGRKRKHLYKKMQMIFQDPSSSLDPRKNVSQLISEPMRINKVYRSKGEIADRVASLMETVGLAERFSDSYAHELDGGRRQRIGIARALSLEPEFIVCDEPVSALDVSVQAQILNLLQDLQEEKNLSYLFITHDLSVVKHISDDILVMYMGCAVELCPAKELFSHAYHPYTKGLLSAIPIPSIHVNHDSIIMEGELTSPIEPKNGCRFASRCPYAKEVCHNETPTFRAMTSGHFVACHCADDF